MALLAMGASPLFAWIDRANAASGAAPTWRHFPADEKGFLRAPVLLWGAKEAILIDGGFTLSDGRVVADAIKATGRVLTTIYVSQSDPDYYFSLGPIKMAFPDARVIAAQATIDAINASVQKKLEVWGPQLKENGPQRLADVVIPQAFAGQALTLEGAELSRVSRRLFRLSQAASAAGSSRLA